MDTLKQKFYDKSEKLRAELRSLIKANGAVKADEVSVAQIYSGMRGVKSILWETSQLDPKVGIRFRGYSIPELQEKLPSVEGCNEPMPEALFWLLLVDEIPTKEQADWVTEEWKKRSTVPQHTYDVMDALPNNLHPMAQFNIAISSMQSESIFSQRYAEGMKKSEYWDASYEDAMNLIAKLPKVAAYLYRKIYHNNNQIASDDSLDWSANYAHMLGNDDEDFKSLMRMYLTIHADHEGGNASAHTSHLVGSTLSDPYLSLSAGMNALAGPLHGLANQEVIKFIFELAESIGTTKPTDEQVAGYVQSVLDSGRVIPGYGHAVLVEPDPRFTAQRVFSEKHIEDDDYVKIVWQLFRVVPPILDALGKVRNPWPNVDAHSGAILVHYGMKEYQYYTVLFGVSRGIGILAAHCWSRALGLGIERPKSITSDILKGIIADAK